MHRGSFFRLTLILLASDTNGRSGDRPEKNIVGLGGAGPVPSRVLEKSSERTIEVGQSFILAAELAA